MSEQKGDIMKKTFSGVLCGIIATLMLAGCKAEVFSKFEYESRGAPWDMVYKLTIDFDKRILITQEADNRSSFSSNPKTKTISLTSEQIAELQKTLNRAGVTGWNDKYDNWRGVCDGSFWDASYVLSDGTSRGIHGDNNWPHGISRLSKDLKAMGVRFIP